MTSVVPTILILEEAGFSPCMSILNRHADSDKILNPQRIFFTTTKTGMSRRIFQTERNSLLFIDVLRSLIAEQKFRILDFVVMPDHVHLLIEVDQKMSIEKAMQLIKGRFSHRLQKESGVKIQIWQRSFADQQVQTSKELEAIRHYIANNPIKAGLANSMDEYPYSFRYLALQKAKNKAALH